MISDHQKLEKKIPFHFLSVWSRLQIQFARLVEVPARELFHSTTNVVEFKVGLIGRIVRKRAKQRLQFKVGMKGRTLRKLAKNNDCICMQIVCDNWK